MTELGFGRRPGDGGAAAISCAVRWIWMEFISDLLRWSAGFPPAYGLCGFRSSAVDCAAAAVCLVARWCWMEALSVPRMVSAGVSHARFSQSQMFSQFGTKSLGRAVNFYHAFGESSSCPSRFFYALRIPYLLAVSP